MTRRASVQENAGTWRRVVGGSQWFWELVRTEGTGSFGVFFREPPKTNLTLTVSDG